MLGSTLGNRHDCGIMGRSYIFECAKCGYRAKVSGRADRGVAFFVQSILCRDCKELYDAVVRVLAPDGAAQRIRRGQGMLRLPIAGADGRGRGGNAPTFEAMLKRMPFRGARRFKWVQFKLLCPVSPYHRVHSWTEPAGCPRCGAYLEKNAVPFRIWD